MSMFKATGYVHRVEIGGGVGKITVTIGVSPSVFKTENVTIILPESEASEWLVGTSVEMGIRKMRTAQATEVHDD
jgi:hypothetical protein